MAGRRGQPPPFTIQERLLVSSTWGILLPPPNCSAPRVGTPHSCGRYGPDAGCWRMNAAFRRREADGVGIDGALENGLGIFDAFIEKARRQAQLGSPGGTSLLANEAKISFRFFEFKQ